MKIKIIALGKVKEDYLSKGIEEFLKRLKSYTNITIQELSPIEIKDSSLIKKSLEEEGEHILSCIKPSDYVITLEILGKQYSSIEFSKKINDIINDGTQELVFVIGSSHGLGENISKRANMKLSLSKMTFLHNFARLLLVEQIYRTFKILNNETYHK